MVACDVKSVQYKFDVDGVTVIVVWQLCDVPAAVKTCKVYIVVTFGDTITEPFVATLPNPVSVADTAFCDVHVSVTCCPLTIAESEGVIVQTGVCWTGLTVMVV